MSGSSVSLRIVPVSLMQGWSHDAGLGACVTCARIHLASQSHPGENIAPVPIEDSVKKLCDGICEVMMVGDKRKYNVAAKDPH